jgi:hypothetical protein
MVALRATKKVLRLLPETYAGGDIPASSNVLGDWYANHLVVDRQPILLLVSSQTLLPILTPARNVRTLPDRLADLVGQRLLRLSVAASIIDAEIEAMGHVFVGPTANRSVVGTMVDFAKAVPWYLEDDNWTQDATGALRGVESKLGTTPCRLSTSPGKFIWPEELSIELLTAQSN